MKEEVLTYSIPKIADRKMTTKEVSQTFTSLADKDVMHKINELVDVVNDLTHKMQNKELNNSYETR